MPIRQVERELTERLWERIRPLLPNRDPGPKGGRPWADDRACFEGVVYVLRSGCRWRDLPERFPSPATCWRRFRDWTAEGVWDRVWRLVLEELDRAGQLDTTELYLDATFAPAQKGGSRSAKPSVARG
jgi:transposase